MARAARKNSTRLKRLRKLGIPIGADYRLTASWANLPAGVYFPLGEQKLVLAALHPQAGR